MKIFFILPFVAIISTQFLIGCASTSSAKGQLSRGNINPSGQSGSERFSTVAHYQYMDLVSQNTRYINARDECYGQEGGEFNEFVFNNILIKNKSANNKIFLFKSKRLLSKNDWATYSWYFSSVTSCIKGLQATLNRLPSNVKNIYEVVSEAEVRLAEQLRLRQINVGTYNQIHFLLNLEEQEDVNSIIKNYKAKAESESLVNQNIEIAKDKPLNSKADNNLGNAAFVTLACSLLTRGKTLECASGASDSLDNSITSDAEEDVRFRRQQKEIRKQQNEIEELRLQQTLDRMRQQQKELDGDFDKRRDDLNKWRPGQK